MKSIVAQLFDAAKTERKSQRILSEVSGVSVESISRAKKRGSMTTDSVEKIVNALGYEVHLKKVALPKLTTSGSAWSSPSERNHPKLLAARLSNASFKDLVELCFNNGAPEVESALDKIKSEIPEKRYRVQRDMLNNIKRAIEGHSL